MTWRARSRYPRVILACPVEQPFRVRHSASSSGPAARWIAPSTPPPPSSELLAALTIASVRWRVMSPCSTRIAVTRPALLALERELAQPVAVVVPDQPLEHLGRVVVRPLAQRDPVAELLADALERGRLVAVGEEDPVDRLDDRRLGRDVVALLGAAGADHGHRLLTVVDLLDLVDDPVGLLVDRRDPLLAHLADPGLAGRAEAPLRHGPERAPVLFVPLHINEEARLFARDFDDVVVGRHQVADRIGH